MGFFPFPLEAFTGFISPPSPAISLYIHIVPDKKGAV
jgi:hypothetical protein